MADVAIRAEGLSKAYRIDHDSPETYQTLRESIVTAASRALRRTGSGRAETMWALKAVSFEVRHGETLGIIGRNGAGKSTLLKILSRITVPTAGGADVYGRLASLLEVGTGFHPELTGRENIFLNGAILGMRRSEIERRFDEIVEFAGTEQFLDIPVKRYSSGMYVRLAFAVAAHLESEILVVDEVLAVGDAEFQRKCLAKMSELSSQGRTVLFVSHNLPAVESLCSAALLLDRGSVAALGRVRDVVDAYLSSVGTAAQSNLEHRKDRQGSGRLRIAGVEADLRTGAASTLRLRYRAEEGPTQVTVLVGIYTERGESAGWLSTELTGADLRNLPDRGTIVCSFDRGALVPGRYTINVHVSSAGEVLDYLTDAAVVDVAAGDYFGTGRLPPTGHGPVVIDHRWSVESL